MFGSQLTMWEAGQVTLIGMGTVFFVLIVLTILISLFQFIPNKPKNIIRPTLEKVKKGSIKLSPLHQAIIVASILESIPTSKTENYIKIKRISAIE